MTEQITPRDVAHVAELARLSLTGDELEAFTVQLADILDHAADLDALDLADVAPTAHPLSLVNVFRADVIGPTSDRDEVLAAAPEVEDAQFKVPPVLGESR